MDRESIIGGGSGLVHGLAAALERRLGRAVATHGPEEPRRALPGSGSARAVYAAGTLGSSGAGGRRWSGPEPGEVEAVLRWCAGGALAHLVVLSSAAVHEPTHHHAGMVEEERLAAQRTANPIPGRWRRLEERARGLAREAGTAVTILRPSAVAGSADPVAGLLGVPVAVVAAGFDPTVQILDPDDLARAVALALERAPEPGSAEVFHLAPAAPVRLRRALRLAAGRPLPIPWSLQVAGRALLAPLGAAQPAHATAYRRYPWTVSGERAARELGFVPRRTSAEAIRALAAASGPERGSPISEASRTGHPPAGSPSTAGDGSPPPPPRSLPRASRDPDRPDPFGMDPAFIDRLGRGPFRFLHDRWFRMETAGLEHVPRKGRAVLAGVHRGFVPFDAIMILHLLARETGRYPRFLIHPGLLKMPVSFDLITRLGGMIACRENAARILEAEELAGIFPEGVRGAFRPYRHAYRLGRFMRDEFVKIALAHRAPIVPMVTVGSAEVFPILVLLEPRWWKRWAEWPGFPITPTFPLLPLPLPAKLHTRFLAPLHVEREHPPEAASDPEVVRSISRRIRSELEEAMEGMLRRRPSAFHGSAFAEPPNR